MQNKKKKNQVLYCNLTNQWCTVCKQTASRCLYDSQIDCVGYLTIVCVGALSNVCLITTIFTIRFCCYASPYTRESAAAGCDRRTLAMQCISTACSFALESEFIGLKNGISVPNVL